MQQGEISNGLPVVSKLMSAANEATDLTNSSVNEGRNGKKNESSGGKTKRKKRKQVDLENEQQNNSSFDLESTDEITKRKRKINKDEYLGHNALFLGGEGTLGEVNAEPKKKKKNLESKSESDDRTIISKKPRQSNHKDSNEGADIVNGNHENEDEMLTSDTPPQTDKLSSVRSSDISVVNADVSGSPEKAESALSTAVEKKVLRKAASRSSEPFAQFQKSSTPPAFVRKCLSRTPKSEPQRRKTNDVQVGDLIEVYIFDFSDISLSLTSCSFLRGQTYTRLTDTSYRQIPLVSVHSVMFSTTYKHYIFNTDLSADILSIDPWSE